MKFIRPLRPGLRCLVQVVLMLPLMAALTAPDLHAQTVSFTSVQTTILDTGLFFPTGVAVSAAGDVFIADLMNNRVVKVSATGTQTEVARELKNPQGVAVDGSGNVFIADTFNNRVLKVTPAGAQSIAADGLFRPMGVAVDASGNLFIANTYKNLVLKVAPGGAQTTVGNGLLNPGGVAVDGAHNIYIADTGNNRVVKVTPAGVQSLVTQWVSQPYGVAADETGNVFIADTNGSRVVKVSSNGTLTDLSLSVRFPYGVAVDRAGTLFIADSNNNRVLNVQLSAANFGSVNVCPSGQSSPEPCSRSLTLNYHIDSGGKLGTPAVLTKGAANLDFKLGGNECVGSLDTGNSCSMNVTFAPMAPGLRQGGVEMTASDGKVLATTFIYGHGQGSAVAYGPGAQTTIASGLSSPAGVAVDAEGNVYIAEPVKHRVLKIAPSGSQTEVGAGLRFPSAVAIGGAGNVLISDTGNNRVIRVRTHGGDQTTIADGLNLPQGIAIDGSGNVFIADYGNNRLLKVAAETGAQTAVGSGLRLPYGVAVDGAGNVYIADYGNDRVLRVSPQGALMVVASGLNFPTAVAVDAAGQVFVADSSNNRVLQIPYLGVKPSTVATGLNRPQGVAVDAVGNIYIVDSGNSRAVEVQRSAAPALNFAPTVIGGINGPQTVTVWNIGNQRFNTEAPGLTIDPNYQLGPGGPSPVECSARLGMGPGASCDLNVSFVPKTRGVLSGAIVLTNNAMNGAPATQTINLSGTGMAPTTTSIQAAAGQYSDSVTLTATVGPAGLSFAGSLRFVGAGSTGCTVAVTGSGTYSCSYVIAEVAQTAISRVELTSPDASIKGSVGFGTLVISPEDATIVPSTANPATIKVNSTGLTGPFILTGILKQAVDGSFGDLGLPDTVSVKLISGTTTIACPAGVNAAGQLSATCKLVPVGSYTVKWSTTDRYYHATTVNTTLTITR